MSQVLPPTPVLSQTPSAKREGDEHGTPAGLLPGLLLASTGVVAATVLHRLLDAVGVLTWAVLLGVLAANLRLVPQPAQPGLRLVTRRLLRIGVALLGFSLPLGLVVALGAPVIALVVVTLTTTLLLTTWLGLRLRLGRARSLLIGTGFAICGASAVAAMQPTAEADEEDVATAVAMVTVWGSLAMIAVPLLQSPLGLSAWQVGVWAGAGVHEVGQVVAAAGPAGAAAVSLAVAVKLTRVLLLAPVVGMVSMLQRRRQHAPGHRATRDVRPPLVPVFLLGFLACVALRTAGLVPLPVLTLTGHAQTACLAAALFALGTGVRFASLRNTGGRALLLGGLSTVVVTGLPLALLLHFG